MNDRDTAAQANGEDPDFTGLCLSLEQWEKRESPKRDLVLGSIFSTTTRAILSADTGLGKTHLGFAFAMSIAAGEPFCHWAGSGKPRRVLVIDGEMPAELVQERLADGERRLGRRSEGFFCLCREDIETMPPIDAFTLDGDGEIRCHHRYRGSLRHEETSAGADQGQDAGIQPRPRNPGRRPVDGPA